MTPWELVKKSEHSHQRAIFAWANCAALYGFEVANHPDGYTLQARETGIASRIFSPKPVPELHRLFAIHNQGHGDKIRGAQAKAEGVKAGVPDIMLPVPRRGKAGLFIELKRAKTATAARGSTTLRQDDWQSYLNNQGYRAIVAIGWLDAIAVIQEYLS